MFPSPARAPVVLGTVVPFTFLARPPVVLAAVSPLDPGPSGEAVTAVAVPSAVAVAGSPAAVTVASAVAVASAEVTAGAVMVGSSPAATCHLPFASRSAGRCS
jgi:hypothetical protein